MRPAISLTYAKRPPLVTEVRPANEREVMHRIMIPARAGSNKRA